MGLNSQCRKRGSADIITYRTRILIVGGGTIGTARLLLASRDRLPFLSAQLGHNIAFNGSVKAAALLSDDLPDGDMFTGRTHPGMISYQFLESHGVTVSAAKAMPLELVAGLSPEPHAVERDQARTRGAKRLPRTLELRRALFLVRRERDDDRVESVGAPAGLGLRHVLDGGRDDAERIP